MRASGLQSRQVENGFFFGGTRFGSAREGRRFVVTIGDHW